MGQEMMGFWDAVASAGLYANNLLQTYNHTNAPSLNFADWMLFLTPNQQCQSTEELGTLLINLVMY